MRVEDRSGWGFGWTTPPLLLLSLGSLDTNILLPLQILPSSKRFCP